MRRDLTEASLVTASEDVVACDLADGAALLDLRSSTYFTLNEVGSQVWGLIREPKPVSEVGEALLKRYDVDPARCRQDLVVLLQQLADAGLINISDARHP